MTTKPGWVAVLIKKNPSQNEPSPFDLIYCGHKHLSFTAATKCARLWRRKTVSPVLIASSR